MCLYLYTSIGSITSAFSLKILGQKEQGGISKVMAVVNMVLNFLITDKSIMAERLNHFSFFIKYVGTKWVREVGMIRGRVRSLQEQHYIQFAKMQLIGPMLLMSKISPPKA